MRKWGRQWCSKSITMLVRNFKMWQIDVELLVKLQFVSINIKLLFRARREERQFCSQFTLSFNVSRVPKSLREGHDVQKLYKCLIYETSIVRVWRLILNFNACLFYICFKYLNKGERGCLRHFLKFNFRTILQKSN